MKWALIAAGITGGLLVLTIIVSALSPAQTPSDPSDSSPIITTTENGNRPSYQPLPKDATPASGMAIIAGKICMPPSGDPIPNSMVVAESIPSRQKQVIFYPGSDQSDTTDYGIELEPGIYEIYTQNLKQDKLALYSEYVTCGMEEFCTRHQILQVQVGPNQRIDNIDICDYSWITDPNLLPSAEDSLESLPDLNDGL